MKKLLFTALAVVAFSGVAMANTVEVKEEVIINNESKVELVVVEEEDNDCYDNAMDFLDMFGTGDDVIDEQLWQILIADCN